MKKDMKKTVELTQENIVFYRENGYLLLKKVFTEEEVLQYLENC